MTKKIKQSLTKRQIAALVFTNVGEFLFALMVTMIFLACGLYLYLNVTGGSWMSFVSLSSGAVAILMLGAMIAGLLMLFAIIIADEIDSDMMFEGYLSRIAFDLMERAECRKDIIVEQIKNFNRADFIFLNLR